MAEGSLPFAVKLASVSSPAPTRSSTTRRRLSSSCSTLPDHVVRGPLDALTHAGRASSSRTSSGPRIRRAPRASSSFVPCDGLDVSRPGSAPKGLPKDIVAKLNMAVVEALADPAVRSRLSEVGYEVFPRERQTPEALAALQKADAAKWWPVIRELGLKAE